MSDLHAILLFRFGIVLGGALCIAMGCGLLRAIVGNDVSFKIKCVDAAPGLLVFAVGVWLIVVAYFRTPLL